MICWNELIKSSVTHNFEPRSWWLHHKCWIWAWKDQFIP